MGSAGPQRRRSELSVEPGSVPAGVVRVDGRSRRDDLVDPVEQLVAERPLERPQLALELLHRARTDDRGGHGPVEVTKASAISISEMPVSSASAPSASAASSLAWLPGSDMS